MMHVSLASMFNSAFSKYMYMCAEEDIDLQFTKYISLYSRVSL